MKEPVCQLCLHGHFYQPPRENPWIEKVELQESAKPYHDWNERIFRECYLPNTRARVLDPDGRILDIVNNFESISFNFGPTLLSWIETHHPETYRLILDADRKSREQHQGFGNAIAQAYNHMIMPLANRRDKETQVYWGVEDFRFRFGRDPLSMWLPETACNEETLEVLVDAGMKFLILEPHQAESVRPLVSGGKPGDWHAVSSGQVDPKRAYRCFLKNDRSRWIDIFFYDGPISKDIGFGDLLFEATSLMNRIDMARPGDNQGLVHMATDGETYGHHKAFGERALAYAMHVEAPRRQYQIVNYAEYLEAHPPEYEVRLKDGDQGEGTSWSCAHGVKRWKEHCGCRGDGPAEWTQHWRAPLRAALDWLRDRLVRVYEDEAGKYFHDVWKARNDYIHVILNRTEANIQNFLERHAREPVTEAMAPRLLKLLEMQRHAMLMYTSCGWFFTELSGIETVQVFAYAARAIELAEAAAGESIEKEFLDRLALAKSNIPDFGDGRQIYLENVKTRAVSAELIAGFYAMLSTFDHAEESPDLYSYQLEILYERKETFGSHVMNFGRIRLTSGITREVHDFIFLALQFGAYDFRCSVKPAAEFQDFDGVEKELFGELHAMHIIELMRRIDSIFGKNYYALKDLPVEQRIRIVSVLTREMLDKVHQMYETLYEDSRRINEIYRSINLPLPNEIREAAAATLTRQFHSAVEEMKGAAFDLVKAKPVERILQEARRFSVHLDPKEVVDLMSRELETRVREMIRRVEPARIEECLRLLELSRKIGIPLDLRASQDYLFFRIKAWNENPLLFTAEDRRYAPQFVQLLEKLHMNPEPFHRMAERAASVPESKTHA